MREEDVERTQHSPRTLRSELVVDVLRAVVGDRTRHSPRTQHSELVVDGLRAEDVEGTRHSPVGHC